MRGCDIDLRLYAKIFQDNPRDVETILSMCPLN
jgi:hypothetical protein